MRLGSFTPLNFSLEAFEFAQVSNSGGEICNLSHQSEAVLPDLFLLRHHQHLVEEGVDRGDKLDDNVQKLIHRRGMTADRRLNGFVKITFSILHEFSIVNTCT